MKSIALILALLATPLLAEDAKWQTIFDGKTLTGWTDAGKANWRVEDGAITVDKGEVGLLVHKDTYKNYELTLEFKAAKDTNSGVFLNTTKDPEDVGKECYELNIAGLDNPFPTGSLVKRIKYDKPVKPDTWHKYDVTVINGHVLVKLNGETIIDHKSDPPSTGTLLGLQKNAGLVAFRNIKVRHLP